MTQAQVWIISAICLFSVAVLILATLLAMRAPGRADEINEQAAMEKEIAEMTEEEFDRRLKRVFELYRRNPEAAEKWEIRLRALRKKE